MSVSAVQNQTTASQSSAAQSAAANALTGGNSVQAMQNRFLTLLVTQMQNQDPLNPMDNSQITTQMAQLSTVTGIDNLNTTMSSLSSAFMSNQVMQSASLIGKSVLSAGSSMNLKNGVANYSVDLPQAVDTMTVTIKNASGSTVRTMNVGAQAAGTDTLKWDGKTDSGAQAPDGTYQFSVTAKQNGSAVTATTLSQDTVSSVSQNAQGVMLNLSNGGPVALSAIKQIF